VKPIDPQTKQHLRKRLPIIILVAVVAWLGTEYIVAQASSVQISYHYGPARHGLYQADMSYRNGDEDLGRVRFTYGAHAASKIQLHKGRFPDGDHEVLVELRYREPAPEALKARAFEVSDNGRVLKLKRPLMVRGEGPVSIFIAEDED
jgi:hypothetical protein